MEKRNTLMIPGIASIIILICVQLFIIKGIWKQRDEMFFLRYSVLSKDALEFINRRLQTDGFDTVRYLLSNYSEQANKEIHAIKDNKRLDAKKKEILDYFTKVVYQEQDLSDLLSNYFERRGFEKKFKFTITILDLEMINNDTIVVYQDEDFMSRRPPNHGGKKEASDYSKDKILVTIPHLEDNNYRFFFEYYIDFSDKQKVILKETSVFLANEYLKYTCRSHYFYVLPIETLWKKRDSRTLRLTL